MDAHLRRLQRAAPGDRAARARVLQDRLRRGEIDTSRLALLAYLGDGAARELAPDAPQPPATLEAWVEGLRPWGPDALTRALAAALRAALPAVEAERPPCAACGNYGQVQVRFAEGFDWEPCPDCGRCDTCQGSRHLGPQRAPCPDCVDVRGRALVDAVEAWVADRPTATLGEHVLSCVPSLFVQHTFEDPARPGFNALCRAGLDVTLSAAAHPERGHALVLGASVAARVVELDRVAVPRGCVGDAIVDALHRWASP